MPLGYLPLNQVQPDQSASGNNNLIQLAVTKKMQEQQGQGGGWWNLLGPLGNIAGQTIDGKEGIDWGSAGQSLVNNVMGGIGIATGNPMLIAQGVKGIAGQSFGDGSRSINPVQSQGGGIDSGTLINLLGQLGGVKK